MDSSRKNDPPHTTSATTSSSGGGSSISGSSGSSGSQQNKPVHRPAVFDKLEQLVRDMQDREHGVPVKIHKLVFNSIPAAFMGYDLIEWLMDRLSIEDSLEAVHLANLLCQFGYYFPIHELKNLLVKDDSSLYRFQSPYYWPSQHHTPDNIEYAIYLAKRTQKNRQKHGLEDYELEAYNNLKKILASKWEFVTMQSEEQVRVARERKSSDKKITESQERAYWRVYRPPPGYTTVVETSPVPTREQRVKARSRTKAHLTEELVFLKSYLLISRAKVSQVAESLIEYTDTFIEFDAQLNPPGPSNPWLTDDQTYWGLNQPIVECPTEKRVRKWSISLENLIMDPLGVQELMAYMKKEYSHENLRFWLAVHELRTGPATEGRLKKKVKEIWEEFLSPGAKAEINIDGKTMEATRQATKSPSRFSFEIAAEHVYEFLLKKDCYPRFIRSESYRTLLANAINPGNTKKRFPFNFGPVKKKISTAQAPGLLPSGQATNQKEKITLEDFNIHGVAGNVCESQEGPEDGGAVAAVGGGAISNRKSLSSIPSKENDESVCPWDGAPAEDSRKESDTEEAGLGSSLDQPEVVDEVIEDAKGSDMPPAQAMSVVHHKYPCEDDEPTQPVIPSSSSSEQPSEVTHSCNVQHHKHNSPSSHHHHHHHHHHSSAAKRAKSRSKRKKSRGSLRSSAAAPSDPALTTPSAVVEDDSAAAAATEQPEQPPPTSTKCTQTKLDDPLPPQPPQSLPPSEAPLLPSSPPPPPAPLPPSQQSDQVPPDTSMEPVSAGEAATGDRSKAEKETWASSTEVCPWEDEENRKESHPPFVKTYATLGYL